MTKTQLRNQLLGLTKYKNLTVKEWCEKIKFRGLEHKFDKQLKDLESFYPKKIAEISALSYDYNDRLTPEQNEEERLKFERCKAEKIDRLKDKFIAVVKEIEFRKKKIVKRKPVGTIYYIDYVNGDDSNDGLSTSTAWKTISKYTSVTVRSPGDIAKVRANQTHSYTADIVFDEDGTVTDYIEIRGCSTTDDPWGDSSDVKPIIDFGDNSYQVNMYNDNYWKLKNIEIIQSGDPNGNVYVYNSEEAWFEDCVIRDSNYSSGAEGIRAIYSEIKLKGCELYSNKWTNLYLQGSTAIIENCVFNGGAATTDYGLNVAYGVAYLISTTFGLTTSHDIADIRANNCPPIYARDCKWSSYSIAERGGFIRSEDDQQVQGAHKTIYFQGTIEKDTTNVRTGGASSSAKMSPTSDVGLNYPLTLTENPVTGDFKIWVPASTTTITIYIKGFGWTTFPTSSELYIEASYYDQASGTSRATVVSNDVLTDNTNWVGFDVTFTPSQAGWVYVTVYLKKYEANSGIYVDIKPVIS
ncbi:MAG: right-handed parallel beta-helix repeat-containing protein [Candidatus Hodarchaeales archaeon]